MKENTSIMRPQPQELPFSEYWDEQSNMQTQSTTLTAEISNYDLNDASTESSDDIIDSDISYYLPDCLSGSPLQEVLPRFSLSKTEEDPTHGQVPGAQWAKNYVFLVKRSILEQRNREANVWDCECIKSNFMNNLFLAELPKNHRKILVREYNKAFAVDRFAQGQPNHIAATIIGYKDMYGHLPAVNMSIFKARHASPHFSAIFTAVYIAGITTPRFIFGQNAYSHLLGCSQSCVFRALENLLHTQNNKKPFIKLLYRGEYCPVTHKKNNNIYALNDPQNFLDAFSFETTDSKNNFIEAVHSATSKFPQNDWLDYIITPDWLLMNNLFNPPHWASSWPMS